MELRDDAVDIKVKTSVQSFTATTQTWSEHSSPLSAKQKIETLVQEHREKMEDYADFDKDRWKEWLQRRVVEDGQGRQKTLDQIRDHFELTGEEKRWMEKWIEVYRRVRLDDMDVERAKRVVEAEFDDGQTAINEVLAQ